MAKKTNYGTTKHYDIIRNVAKKEGLTQTLVTQVYRGLFAEIVESLNAGTNVTIPCFASFDLVDVPAHKARNPKTGEIVQVPAKTVVKVRRRKNLAGVSAVLASKK